MGDAVWCVTCGEQGQIGRSHTCMGPKPGPAPMAVFAGAYQAGFNAGLLRAAEIARQKSPSLNYWDGPPIGDSIAAAIAAEIAKEKG
jgi:hypothetical protein